MRVGERLFHRAHGAVNDRLDQCVKFAAREFVHEEFAVRQREAQRSRICFRRAHASRRSEPCAVPGRILRVAEKSNLPFCRIAMMDEGLQEIVDIVAAEMRVAVGGEDLVDVAFAGGDQLQDGNIERAAAEIVDGHVAALFFVQAIG